MGMFSSFFGDGGAAERASNVAAAKQLEAGQLVDSRYKELKGNYQPYMDAGTGALSSYQGIANGIQGQVNPILGQMGDTVNSMNPIIGKLTSDNLNDYQKAPGYDARMQAGVKALQNSAAANGNLFSGATGQALMRYGQDYGTNDYQNYLGNLQNQLTAVNTQFGAQGNLLNSTINGANASLNAYSPLIQTGYDAANAQAGMGMSAAQQQGQYIAGAGQSTASGMQATSNSLSGAGGNWVKLGTTLAGGLMGGMGGAAAGGFLSPASGGQTPVQGMPWLPGGGTGFNQTPGAVDMGSKMPWLNGSSGSLSNGALF